VRFYHEHGRCKNIRGRQLADYCRGGRCRRCGVLSLYETITGDIMKIGDIIAGMFILILVYLVVINYKGANQLLATASGATIGLTKTLQGR